LTARRPGPPASTTVAEHPLDPADLDGVLHPLLDASRWYVGFSGGLDSTVLLDLLVRWRAVHADAPALTALHVNHGLHPLAGSWQAHCERLASGLGVPLIALQAAVDAGSRGLEAAAREARYRLFETQLGPGSVLLLAHHLDDQVETFFLRLLRGAGPAGLAAMPPERPLGAARLARPLLQVPRARLEAYARASGLAWVEDPSNRDTGLDRNFLRTAVLPLLADRWPGYRATVARAGAHLAGVAAMLEQQHPAPEVVLSRMGDPGVPLAALLSADLESAALRLRHWLQARGLPAPDRAALAEFLHQLRSAREGAAPRLACRAFTLQRYRDAVYLLPAPASPPPADALALAPGATLAVPGVGDIGLVPATGEGFLLPVGEGIQLRWRQGGERCRPVSRAGSGSLKQLLQEAGVPPWWRDRVPLFFAGGELLAVGDLWLCASTRWRARPGPGEELYRPHWARGPALARD